jgi:uncharacterized protein YoxC
MVILGSIFAALLSLYLLYWVIISAINDSRLTKRMNEMQKTLDDIREQLDGR